MRSLEAIKRNWKYHEDTIKAEVGYRVSRNKEDNDLRLLRDGNDPIMIAIIMDYETFLENLFENEAFGVCEVFTTTKGNKFLYARDEEADEDYLIKC